MITLVYSYLPLTVNWHRVLQLNHFSGMATYRYSKYDKRKKRDYWPKKLLKSTQNKFATFGRKPLNLKPYNYYTRKLKKTTSTACSLRQVLQKHLQNS